LAGRVLVAGGSGFIGGHVARALAAAGYEVLALGRGGRPAPVGVVLRSAERSDPAALARALAGERFDATLDCSGYDRAGVESLLGVERFEPGRYVLVSSGQVCLVGTAPAMPYREEDADYPLQPEPPPKTLDHRQWSYGVGKRGAETAVKEARELRGLPALILRLPVILGAGDTSLRTWAYLQRFLDGGPVLVPDGGAQTVRFMWVEDVAQTMVHVLDRWPLPSAVYHLAQPDLHPLRDVIERLAALSGRTPKLESVASDALSAARIGPECSPYSGRWVSVLDPGRAEREWSFTATPLDGYLSAIVRAHLERPPASSHPGYAHRDLELALARRLKSVAS
jgi:nucleoside-diphosphate-sugar epimerase